MTTPTKQQQYERLRQLFALSRQRYLSDGGNPHRPASGNTYLTAEEQQEFKAVARELSTKATATDEGLE